MPRIEKIEPSRKPSNTTGGWETYRMFQAVRIHYVSDSYDYFRYNGSIKSDYSTFVARKDKYSYVKLGKFYEPTDMLYFLAFNLYNNPKMWVHDFFYDEPRDFYKAMKTRQEDRLNQLKLFLGQHKDFKSLIVTQKNEHPKLFSMLQGNQVSHDIVAILEQELKFTEGWAKAYPGDVAIDEFVFRFNKFRRFVINFGFYDTTAYANLIQENT